jgi:hypothetical protein
MAECGECTLCCDLFEIKWLNKPINTKCIYCDKGCKIYDSKPKECTDFNCMYIQVENISEDLRPDKCKVIFEKKSDTQILGTLDARYELTDMAKRQIVSFLEQGFEVKLVASDFRKPIIWQPTEQI